MSGSFFIEIRDASEGTEAGKRVNRYCILHPGVRGIPPLSGRWPRFARSGRVYFHAIHERQLPKPGTAMAMGIDGPFLQE
jgi:hypothetical protein